MLNIGCHHASENMHTTTSVFVSVFVSVFESVSGFVSGFVSIFVSVFAEYMEWAAMTNGVKGQWRAAGLN